MLCFIKHDLDMGPVSSKVYKFDDIEPIVGTKNDSIMRLFLSHQRMDLLKDETQILPYLLQRKWQSYGVYAFIQDLLVELMHIVAFAIGSYHQQYDFKSRASWVAFILHAFGILLKVYTEFSAILYSKKAHVVTLLSGSPLLGMAASFVVVLASSIALIVKVSKLYFLAGTIYSLVSLVMLIDILCLFVNTEFLVIL